MKASRAGDEHAVRGTYLFEISSVVVHPLPRVHRGEIPCTALTLCPRSVHLYLVGETQIGGFRADGPAATQRTR